VGVILAAAFPVGVILAAAFPVEVILAVATLVLEVSPEGVIPAEVIDPICPRQFRDAAQLKYALSWSFCVRSCRIFVGVPCRGIPRRSITLESFTRRE